MAAPTDWHGGEWFFLANLDPMFSFTWQVLVIATWTAILVNNPVRYSWFGFHPPLQTLALCFFTYGLCHFAIAFNLYISHFKLIRYHDSPANLSGKNKGDRIYPPPASDVFLRNPYSLSWNLGTCTVQV